MADFSPTIPVYRNKETQPTYFSLAQIHNMVRGLEAGKQAGAPAFASENYLPRMLKEVRSDAGTNEYDYNNPKSQALYKDIYKTLAAQGIENGPAAWYPIAVADKLRESKRLGLDFDKAFIGTGKAKNGMTGDRYAAIGDVQTPALFDPRNANLLSYVERSRADKLTPQERLNTHPMDWTLSRVFGNKEAEREALKQYASTLSKKDQADLMLSEDSLTNASNLTEAYRKRSGFVEPTYSKNNMRNEQRWDDHRTFTRKYLNKLEEQTPIASKYLDTRLGVTPAQDQESWIDKHVNLIKGMFSK